MRSLIFIAAAWIGLGAWAQAHADAQAAEIDRCIDQLGSPLFQDREAASKALLNIGESALKKLDAATKHRDPEIRRRASDLAREIAKRFYVELRCLVGHQAGVEAAVFSPDGRTLFSGDYRGVIRVWATESGKELRRWQAHGHWFFPSEGWIECLAVSPDGRQLLSGARDGTARLWDLKTSKELRRWSNVPIREQKMQGKSSAAIDDWVNSVAFSPDSRRTLIASWRSGLRLCDNDTGKEVVLSDSTADRWFTVFDAVFSPDNQRIAYSRADNSVHLRELPTGGKRQYFQLAKEDALGLQFTPDGRRLVSANQSGAIRVWDLVTKREAQCLRGHDGVVQSVAVSPDGTRVLSGGNDHTVRLWNIETGREVFCFRGHTEDVYSVGISSDGKLGLSASADKTIRLWRLSQ